jgi:hypothetical protein
MRGPFGIGPSVGQAPEISHHAGAPSHPENSYSVDFIAVFKAGTDAATVMATA